MRACDHQHGHNAFQSIVVEAAGNAPADECEQRDRNRHKREIKRGPIRQILRPAAAVLCFGNQPHDARQRGLFTCVGNTYPERSAAVNGARNHLVALALVHRPTFAGNHGFVDLAFAVGDLAIYWHTRPRSNQHQIVIP